MLQLDELAKAAARKAIAKPTKGIEPPFEPNGWVQQMYALMAAAGLRIPDLQIDRSKPDAR